MAGRKIKPPLSTGKITRAQAAKAVKAAKLTDKQGKAGQPSKYREEYNEQAYRICLLYGATDKKLGEYFGVCERTINNWKENHPKFLQSVNDGKDIADAKVSESLYNRALGYSHEDTHISNYQGEIKITPTMKHYPPDATSAIFWLKNRQKDKWRDTKVVGGDPENPIELNVNPSDKLRDFLNDQSKRIGEVGDTTAD